MVLSETKAIYDSCSSEEANRFLAAGWKLYKITKTVCDYLAFEDEEIHYILLWTQESDPVYPTTPFEIIR